MVQRDLLRVLSYRSSGDCRDELAEFLIQQFLIMRCGIWVSLNPQVCLQNATSPGPAPPWPQHTMSDGPWLQIAMPNYHYLCQTITRYSHLSYTQPISANSLIIEAKTVATRSYMPCFCPPVHSRLYKLVHLLHKMALCIPPLHELLPTKTGTPSDARCPSLNRS